MLLQLNFKTLIVCNDYLMCENRFMEQNSGFVESSTEVSGFPLSTREVLDGIGKRLAERQKPHEEGNGDSKVREPRKPLPSSDDSGIEVPLLEESSNNS